MTKLHKYEEEFGIEEGIKKRREWLNSQTDGKFDFDGLDNKNFEYESIYNKNCENIIGAVSVPVGIAGPAKVNGKYAKGDFMVPLATTEGALVASINRGLKLIRECGGANVRLDNVGITRAPVYMFESIEKREEFVEFFESNLEKFDSIIKATSPYISIISHEFFRFNKALYIRFAFDTTDAMGMNMAVITCKALDQFFQKNFSGAKLLSLSGNVCIDKKPGKINSLKGRGKRLEAWIDIPLSKLEEILKTTGEDFVEVVKQKTHNGSFIAGSLGRNAHVANVYSAFAIATGQDPAQTVGASLANFDAKIEGENLNIYIELPSVNVATIGGGTRLETQNILNSTAIYELNSKTQISKDSSKALAEIFAVLALAGEISLHAAFSSDSFVDSHKTLGR